MTTWTEPRVTKLTFDEARSCLGSALRTEVGAPVRKQVLALAMAKTALETGRWQKMYNFCFGNIKANIATYPGMFTTFRCNEVLNRNGKGIVVWFAPEGELASKNGPVVGTRYEPNPGHPQTRFRAYANATDGAYEYVFFQARELTRYRAAWQFLLAGDVEGYVRALSAAKYFTAPVEDYLRTVRSLYGEFLGKLDGRDVLPVDVPDRWEWQEDAVRAYGAQFSVGGIIASEGIREMSDRDHHDTEPAPPPDDDAPITERAPGARRS